MFTAKLTPSVGKRVIGGEGWTEHFITTHYVPFYYLTLPLNINTIFVLTIT